MVYVFLIVIGIIAGFASGLFGIGGGIIIVPAFYFIFKYFGLPIDQVMRLAVGTSLAVMIFSSLSSFSGHLKYKNIIWKIVLNSLAGIAIGIVLGAVTSDFINGEIVAIIFSLFLLFTAAKITFQLIVEHKKGNPEKVYCSEMKKSHLGVFGFILGYVSTLLGIGGGSIAIPYFLHNNIEPKKIAGTTASYTVIVSIIGTSSYLILGFGAVHDISYTIGYIYLPALFCMVPPCLIFARIGAKIANHAPEKLLKILLIILIAFAGVKMLFT